MSIIPDGIIAHRGVCMVAPENTMASFRQAAAQGVSWIEADTSLLGDGELIICHDSSVDRCSNGTGKLADLNTDDIHGLDIGSWFSPEFKDERFPFLRAALKEIQQLGLGLNLEFKIHEDEAEELIPAFSKIIQECWHDFDRLVVSSFDWEGLLLLRRLSPEIKIGMLMNSVEAGWLETAKELNAFSIHAHHKKLTREDVEAVKDAGLELYIFTPNEPEKVSMFWDWGIDAVITDCPAAFQEKGIPRRQDT